MKFWWGLLVVMTQGCVNTRAIKSATRPPPTFSVPFVALMIPVDGSFWIQSSGDLANWRNVYRISGLTTRFTPIFLPDANTQQMFFRATPTASN
jgi:hypothetical protein